MRSRKWSSGSTWPNAGCGEKRSTGGRRPSSWTRPTPLRSTIWRSRTSTRGNWTRRARRTTERSSSTRTTPRFVRTTSFSRKSMTGRIQGSLSVALAALAAVAAAVTIACGTDYFEIPIEAPIQPKMDVSPFQRVLVAGFVAGGTEDVDANQETVRLLRSRLRTKSQLKVIDADIMPLIDIAQDQTKAAAGPGEELVAVARDHAPNSGASGASGATTNGSGAVNQPMALPKSIKEEKDLEPYERLFANTAYWKRIGEEYQNPLIVTGTVLFSPNTRSGFVQREQEVYDGFGRRRVMPVRAYMERKGFVLRPK